MKTVAIDMGRKPNDVRKLFEKKGISEGDKVIVNASKEEAVYALLFFMVIVAMALIYVVKKNTTKNGDHETDLAEVPGMNNEALLRMETPEAIERAIEENLGVQIEINFQENAQDSIDSLFGLWKDRDISIEKIRETAWRRA